MDYTSFDAFYFPFVQKLTAIYNSPLSSRFERVEELRELTGIYPATRSMFVADTFIYSDFDMAQTVQNCHLAALSVENVFLKMLIAGQPIRMTDALLYGVDGNFLPNIDWISVFESCGPLALHDDVIFESFDDPPPDDTIVRFDTIDSFLAVAEPLRGEDERIAPALVIDASTHAGLPIAMQM